MAPASNSEPIAIVGLGCRWPGGVHDAPGLWELLKNKRSGYREFDAPRFSAKGFYHPNPDRPGSMTTRGGFLVDEDPRLFDPAFFGMTGLEVENMDPSQRKLLEVVYESIENAGETLESISGSRTGVFVGNFSFDHWVTQARDWDRPRPYALTGASTSILSNRISYMFDLHGPSLALDTACSSSMYAVHLAVSAIRSGDCDSAIVAASNWIMDPSLQMTLDKLGALSPTSTCHTFDISADGYARGEGFAALYLKKATLAVGDGSPIRAFIRGTAVNANGRTGGITRPSAAGQEAVIRKAYQNAGDLPFSDTTYFEVHGTGTPVGDPIEVSAVGNVFSSVRSDAPEDRLLIGSVKTNLGHTEGASALAGIMKVVLSLESGLIPPSIGVETLNPAIDFDKSRVEVVRDVIPWPKNKMRRASINSFGFGGANGHCIIDHVNEVLPNYIKPGVIDQFYTLGSAVDSHHSNGHASNGHASNGHAPNGHAPNGHAPNGHTLNGYPSNGQAVNHMKNGFSNGEQTRQGGSVYHPIFNRLKSTGSVEASTRQLVLLPFSAHNEASLSSNIDAFAGAIERYSLADVAYTLGTKRSKRSRRTFRIVDKDNTVDGLGNDKRIFTSPARPANVGFVFTGQGAQWHSMGAQLFEYHVFRGAIKYLDYVLGTLPNPPSWTLENILSGNCEEDFIQTPQISQTACTAVQVGLVDLLSSWSVRPSGVVGHSSGEMAAAYAAGRITSAEAITAAYFRGQAVSANKQKGAMLAVGLETVQAYEYLQGQDEEIKIAAINSPSSITLSGEVDAIERLSAILTKDGVFNRLLRTGGNAYHSHHMVALGSEYAEMLDNGLARLKQLGLIDEERRYPRIPWVSSVTPNKELSELDVGATYWRLNLESPVQFSQAVSKLISSETHTIDVLVEVGPHGALKSPLDQIAKSLEKSVSYAPSLQRKEDGRISLLQLAGTLFGLNAEIDLVSVNAVDGVKGTELHLVHGCTAIDLPPYRYTYGPVSYLEGRASKEYRLRNTPRHDLLGSKVTGNAKLRPQWRNILRLKDLPWLGDHRLIPNAIFPAAGYLCMAVIAASQSYNEFPEPLQITGFSLRNVAIKSAMKIPEDDYGIEIVLSMELADIATAKSPAWSSFSLSSVVRDSNEWTEHCTGLIKVEISKPEEVRNMNISIESDPRTVDAGAWYKKFAGIGLGYGPTFQALSEIRADPDQSFASAKLALNTTENTIKGGESSYSLHPASLDGIIQLGLIACYGGSADRASTAFVPIHLNQMYLKNSNEKGWGTALAHGELRGLRGAYSKLQLLSQTGDVVLNIDSLRHISYRGEAPSGDNTQRRAFSSPFTRLVWKPDIRMLDNKQSRELFPPPQQNVSRVPALQSIDRIAALIVLDLYDKFVKNTDRTAPSGNVGHFISWIRRRVEEDEAEFMIEAKQLSNQERLQMLQALYGETDHLVEVQMARRIHDNFEDIFQERRTGVDILVEDGLLTALYETGVFMTGAYPQLSNLLDSLAHVNPDLRILELGAGTGGATRVAMKALRGSNGIKRYRQYTFTDISPGFLTAARESMSEFHDIDFAVLNIEEDPLKQEMQPVYDVVMASQILHATESISNTLENCRKLLKPDGKILMVENTTNNFLLGIILGTLTGYWHGIPDGRTDGPFMSLGSWDSALTKAGFSGTEVVLDDNPPPHNTATTIMSTLAHTEAAEDRHNGHKEASELQLIHGAEGAPPLLSHLLGELKRRGVSSRAVPIDQVLNIVTPDSHVVAFLDKENLLLDTDEHRLKAFQHLARSTASMIWITSCGMVKGRDPSSALMAGLLRTLGTENPALRFRSVDIDAEAFDIEDSNLVRCLADLELDLQKPSSDESEDREFVWQDGCLWVSRLVPDAGLQEYSAMVKKPSSNRGTEMLPLDSQGPARADFETPGILSSLYFRPNPDFWKQLPHDWIEVKVAAVGLNWKDLGLSSGHFDANNLSSEYTGVVTRTGPHVTGLAIGDRVYGMGRGHFGNYTRVPAAFAHKLQLSDDLVEMATMPLVYMTAIYAFEHISRLRQGQTVLIQSATGGLGIAAIQVAQMKGAEVYVTAGTDDKAHFLAAHVGIPSSHIFSSRDVSDLSKAAAMTQKGGFDVILSASKGDMLHASFKALAPLGHLIDVGRMDVQDAKTVGLELFQKSANFSSFDLALVLDNDPAVGASLIQAVDQYYRAGFIRPIRPMTPTDISQLDQVLLGFSKGTHIGKLVVTFLNQDSLVRMLPSAPAAHFDPEACYIITGGLSGLGRSLIRWMSDRGARHVTVLSRRGSGSPEAQTLIESLAARGVTVQPVVCDVSKQEQVARAVKEASLYRPVKGIVHTAVSYQDLSFDKLSIEQWQEGLAAKVLGTINLHEATSSLPLDFFVMTTSVEPVFAPATQSAYTAGNNFQDYFARYRRRLGLPASAVSFGLVSDVGHLSTDSTAADLFARNKVLTMSEYQFLSQIEPAFLDNELAKTAPQWIGLQQDPLSSVHAITCMDPAAMAASKHDEVEAGLVSVSSPRWYSDKRVSQIMRAFDDAQRHGDANLAGNSVDEGGKSAAARLRREFDEAIKALPKGRTETLGLVTEGIITAMAEMLFVEKSGVNSGKSVAGHGVDSLIAAELRNWFHVALGFNVSMLDLLDAHISIDALAANIVDTAIASSA
ncbi:Type I Iterative PKS [Arachnomyces sp. PD_36]|nr:Type I Iterative PKS [Arachnomyces sp. PD_36]